MHQTIKEIQVITIGSSVDIKYHFKAKEGGLGFMEQINEGVIREI